MRFGELEKNVARITDKILTGQLRQLEREGFIHRKPYPVVPFKKVEYSISDKGMTAIPIIEAIRNYVLELMEAEGVGEKKE
nr:winged helix-turn-helix transcriptional regulator [Persicobacter sp. CCB-QB2]